MSRFDSIDVFKDISDESANETEDEREQAKPIAEELKRDDEGPQPEKLLKKKRVRVDKPFDENMLTSGNGLERIYQEFPNIYKCGGRGSEAKSLKKLTAMYKEWAFQLHRGLAFQDVLSKCETLGSKGQVRSHLHRLRELERDRYIEELAKSMPAPPTPSPIVAAAAASSARLAAPSSSSSSSSSVRLASTVAHDDDDEEENQIGLSDSEEEDEASAIPTSNSNRTTEKSPTSVSADNIVEVDAMLEEGSPSKKARKQDVFEDDIFSETEEAASLASPTPLVPAVDAAKGVATFSISDVDDSGAMSADYTQIEATLVE